MPPETVTTVPTELRWWRRIPYYRAVAVYVTLRLTTLAVTSIADIFTHHGLVSDLSNWDGVWFLRAVSHGYPSHLPMAAGHVLASPIALFPLFPLLIRTIADVTFLSASVVGLLISGVTGLGAVVAIGRLTNEFTDTERAERAALLFAVAPGGFVFNLIYNEGIVISLVALGLIALLRRRWLVAGALGALATAASPVGLVFVVCCAASSFVAVRRDRDWRSLFAPILAPTGFAAWMIYLWIHTGNVRAWQLTERGGWNSYPSLVYPFRIVGTFITNPLAPTMTGQILFFGTLLSVAGLVIAFRERLPFELLSYASCSVVLFAVSSPVGLRPRFVMLAFPLTIAVASRWSGRRFHLVVAGSVILLLLMTYETLTSFAVFP